MNKEELKKTQPVAWRTLSHALKNRRLSHAYLFYGQRGAPLSEMALLLAQSVFCEHPDEDGFACQECRSCRQTAKEQLPDFYWLKPGSFHARKSMSRKERDRYWKSGGELPAEKTDNKPFSIRKENILNLQDTFSKTAENEKGNQVYILEQYENANPSASNSLLKFLEEPQPGLIGILCTNEISRVLPTIVSRTQTIALRPAGHSIRKARILELTEDEEAAAILAESGYDAADAESFFSEHQFFSMRDAAREFFKARASHPALIRLQREVFPARSRDFDRTALMLFVQSLLWIIRHDESLPLAQRLACSEACLHTLDLLRTPADPALMVDQLAFELQKAFRQS